MVAKILVGMLCTHLLCFAVMFLLISRRLAPRQMGMDCFALGNFLLGSAYVLQLLEVAPAWSVTSVLNHTFTLASPVVYGIAAMRFFGRTVPLLRPLLLFALVYSAMQVLAQWWGGPDMRYALLSGVSAFLFLVMVVAVLHGVRTFAKDLHVEMKFFAVLILGLCVLNAVKFFKIVHGGVDALQLDQHFQQVFYLYMSFLATVLPPSIIWLVLCRLSESLRNIAARDPMTQLLNRRGVNEALQQYFSLRKAEPVHLLVVDVDHFKPINDTYGHQAGDAVLCQVAQVLQNTVRRGDMVGRIGGEEFVVVCLETDMEGVMYLAERLRSAVERQVIRIPGVERPLKCTITIGASAALSDVSALDSAMRQADSALYKGKASGRNRVEAAGPAYSSQLIQRRAESLNSLL